jgi:cell division protein FtsQ
MKARLEGARFRRSPAAAAILTSIALGLGIWTVTGSRLFAIQLVKVTGVEELTAEEVERLSGVEVGENLLRLSTDAVAYRVASSPWVAEARVSRMLPSTLQIDVVERRAVGWLSGPGGLAIVGADGLVLERVPSEPRDLPALGGWSAPLEAGDHAEDLGAPLRVAASLSAAMLHRVSEVAMKDEEIVLGLRTGGEVRFGQPAQLEAKARTLASLLAWIDDRGIEDPAIDLRIPSAPAVTPPS